MQNLIITNAGKELITRLISEATTATFTKIVVSDENYENYSESDISSLTKLRNIKQTVLISEVSRTDGGTIEVVATINNSELTKGYYTRALGVIVEDSKGTEILFAVSLENDNPCYVPQFDGKTVSSITYRLNIKVYNSKQVIEDSGNWVGVESNTIKRIGFTNDCDYVATTFDGSTAFSKAISAASDGDTIVVMPGDYKGTSTLTIAKNINFVGLGLPTVNFPIDVMCPASFSWETYGWLSKDTYSTSWTNIAFKNTIKVRNESAMDEHYASVFNAKNCVFGNSDDSSLIAFQLGESELFDCYFENCTVTCGSYVGYGGAEITFKNCAFSNAYFGDGSITNPTCYQCNFKYIKDPNIDNYSGTFINCDITSTVTFEMSSSQSYSNPILRNCNLFGKNPFTYYSGSGTLFEGTSI